MIMSWRIATAILIGGAAGSSVVYAFGFGGFWPLVLGMLLGGSVAWFAYCWRDIVVQAPRVWASVSGWRPDYDFWKYFLPMLGLIFVVGAELYVSCVALLLLSSIISWESVTHGNFFISWGLFSLFSMAGLVFFTSPKQSEYSQYHEAKKDFLRMKWAVNWMNLIGALVALIKFVFWAVPRTPVLARFGLKLFVAVHSKDALDSFIYAATGVLVGWIFFQNIYAIPASALSGFLLAFVGRWLSKKLAAPYLARTS
ncbi:MAG: hypothetical protein V4436_01640 [Patescibacteria group bacterium]